MPVQFQIVIFAVIAAFVLFQLYNVLGKKVGRQPQEDAKTLATPSPTAPEASKTPALDAALLASIAGLKARDPAFDPHRFLEGARQAYETIVRGYAAGDRAALKPLLTPTVMASFEAGIAARETRGETETVAAAQSGPRAGAPPRGSPGRCRRSRRARTLGRRAPRATCGRRCSSGVSAGSPRPRRARSGTG